MANSVSNSSFYPPERCGICENEELDADRPWSNPVSSMAHVDCINKIQELDAALWLNIHKIFHNPNDVLYKNEAHRNAIGAIKRKIGNVSILTYLDNEGKKKLTEIFSSQEVLNTIRESKNFLKGRLFSYNWE